MLHEVRGQLAGDEPGRGHARAVEEEPPDPVPRLPAHDERADDPEHRERDDQRDLLGHRLAEDGDEVRPDPRGDDEAGEDQPRPARRALANDDVAHDELAHDEPPEADSAASVRPPSASSGIEPATIVPAPRLVRISTDPSRAASR